MIARILCILLLLLSIPSYGQCAHDVLVTLDLRDVEAAGFFRATGKLYGLNVVVDERVKGQLNLNLREVPLLDAMSAMASSVGCTVREISAGVLMVEPSSVASRDEQELLVQRFPMSFLAPDDNTLEVLSNVLSARGTLKLSASDNSIVVKDVEVAVQRVGKLIASMDFPPEQFLIEARIVEVDVSSGRELGIAWGSNYSRNSNNVLGGLGTVDADVGVNLPTANSEGTNPLGLSLGFGVVSDRVVLDLRLSALEQSGAARIVSSPKIRVLNNHTAIISDGEILFADTGNAGTTIIAGDGESNDKADNGYKVTTFDALLKLEVLPRILGDGRINMNLRVKREEFDHAHEVQGYPLKKTRSAVTELVVNQGATVAIGGIQVERTDERKQEVSGLGKIPIIGMLFRNKQKSTKKRELFIFLTPTIIKEIHAGNKGDIQG